MNTFLEELRALVEKWREQGESIDDLIDALHDEAESLEELEN